MLRPDNSNELNASGEMPLRCFPGRNYFNEERFEARIRGAALHTRIGELWSALPRPGGERGG